MTDRRQPPHAPAHLVEILEPISQPPGRRRDCTPEVSQQCWRAQLQQAADRIWGEAYTAGAAASKLSAGAWPLIVAGSYPVQSDDALIGRLTAAINRRIDRACVADAGGNPLSPADSIRLCAADLDIVALFAATKRSQPRTARARGRLSALNLVAKRLARAYGISQPDRMGT